MSDDTFEQLKLKLLDLDMAGTIAAAGSIVDTDADVDARRAIDTVAEALQIVGKRFQDGEWFLAELVYAGEIAREAIDLLSPLMTGEPSESLGTIVVGTVAGDLHDLGKNIFINHARSAGFSVIDLGIDVPVDRFVEVVMEHRPLVLGMSCLMTSTTGSLGRVVEELERRGLRGSTRVIIGGAALTQQYADEIGVDAFAPDAVTGTDIIKSWSR